MYAKVSSESEGQRGRLPNIRNRWQVATSFPILARFLIAGGDGADHIRLALLECIDLGHPLVAKVADLFSVQRQTVRRALKLRPGEVGEFWAERLTHILCLLDVITADAQPSDLKGWLMCQQIWHRYEMSDGLIEPHSASFANISRIKHGCALASVTWCAAAKKPSKSLRPRIQDTSSNGGASPWDSTNSWAPLLPSPFTFEGVSIRSLTSPWELECEGNEMHHCVGNYIDECRSGQTHIVSLCATPSQDELEPCRSTAEINLVDSGCGDWIVQVEQHFGYGNTPTPVRCTSALCALVRHLQSGAYSGWFAELQKFGGLWHGRCAANGMF